MLIFHRIVVPTAIGVLAACLPIAVQAGNSRFQEAISPDQSMVAYVNAEDGDAEIYIERADGSDRRRLTNNDCHDNDPSWSPDGKDIAFASDRSGEWQIHRMDSCGDNVVQLTNQGSGCVQPKFGSQGQLAYLIRRGRELKRELFELVVSQGSELKSLQPAIPIYSFAWHPDGEVIGCASDGRFILHNLCNGTTKLLEFNVTDARLSSYSIVDCRWSTKLQGFIGHLRYLGGVPEGTKVFADGELFLIPLEGRARFVADELPDRSRSQAMAISPHFGAVWLIGDDDSKAYFMSGSFTIMPPADSVSHSDEHVWSGTIELSPIRIVNRHSDTGHSKSEAEN